ncbi:hypothetical protein J5N97_029892 [Dioscorea zingiberensis]|uniref:Uncharacterized protein n=1 Tax=Dioscorea zingiberensis TaxID=325984 RepID=A0A9D5BWN4_9LILI|nr:hypothetical protein J5N97_029892 [Dioscorea zingiberensis]
MSFSKRFEHRDPFSAPFFYRETSIFRHLSVPSIDDLEDELGFALDLMNPISIPIPSPFSFPHGFFESATDLVLVDRMEAQLRRAETKAHLQSLSNRVAELELNFARAMRSKPTDHGRNCKWMAEIKGSKGEGIDWKFKWMDAEGQGEKNVKWRTGITGKGEPSCPRYTFPSSMTPAPLEAKEKGKKWTGTTNTRRVLEIEEPVNPGCIALKK